MFVALRSPPGTDAPATVGAMLLTATLVLAPIVAVTGTFVPLGYPWGVVEWSIIAMMLVNSFSYAVFYHLIQIAGPVFAAQTAYVVTLAGVAWGIVLFGEQHSLWVWAALVLMLLGLALVSPRPARRDAS
jgi:drug/metabolite transporter (DMT)-like permease